MSQNLDSLFQVALAIQDYCEVSKLPFCFIGGLAIQRWGEPRVTRDVDLTIFTAFEDERVIDLVLKKFLPKMPSAREFALTNRVLLLNSESGIGIDISLGILEFEEEMVKRATKEEFLPGIFLKVCSPEDLVILKTFAAREKDWGDVENIIIRSYAKLDWSYIESQLKPLLELKEEPELYDQLISRKKKLLKKRDIS